jgi:hypothetical protein
MTDTAGPFFYSQVKCPVCDSINAHTNIRTGAYRANGKDSDYCPTGLVWTNPAHQKYVPLLFFMATCTKCFYTREFNAEFKSWEKDDSFTGGRARVKAQHMAAFDNKNGLIQFVAPYIDPEKYPTESAIIKFILGIHDELLTGRPSPLSLARYFLRIAWLLRGRRTPGSTPADAKASPVARLRREVADAESVLSDYEGKIKRLRDTLESVGSSLKNGPGADRFTRQKDEALKELSASLPPLLQAASKLTEVCADAEQATQGNTSTGEEYFTFGDFRQFLIKARQLLSEVPTTEKEALSKAVEYYTKADETGTQIQQGLPQLQTMYLIAELSRRAGDFKNATQYFNALRKMGWELVQRGEADTATVNQTNKLLTLAGEQARTNKEEQAEVAV